MRKIASIILLLILLFNIVGYRAWFYYAEQKVDVALESRLDKELYDVSDLVSITIPLNDPYQIEQSGFERVSGEINVQGQTYKFVKRRISDGNLVLLCIPDTRKMVLKKANTDFGNALNGLACNSKNPTRSGAQKSFNSSDYLTQSGTWEIGKFEHESIPHHSYQQVYNPDPQIDSPGKPPQYLS